MVEYINERYLGSKEDIPFIQEYLDNRRKSAPKHLGASRTLREWLKTDDMIDKTLFQEVSNQVETIIKKEVSGRFCLLPPERYYIGLPQDIGGFHGKPVGGFFYFEHCGFTYFLDRGLIKNVTVRTYETARNYLHNSIHAFTFRTFGKVPPHMRSETPVYREQYGINFRNPEGRAYSSKALTLRVPFGINLNLLMDGVVMLYIASTLNKLLRDTSTSDYTDLEKCVFEELVGASFNIKVFPQALPFHYEVITPTSWFIHYWNGDGLLRLILKSMFSGNLNKIKKYFAEKSNNEDAWEDMFKQETFIKYY